MNANQIVNMVVRMVMRRLIRSGVNTGMDAMAKRRGNKTSETKTGPEAAQTSKRAKQSMRIMRRLR